MSEIPPALPFDPGTLLKHASTIVTAYVSKNSIAVSDIPVVLRSVHGALACAAGAKAIDQTTGQKPAVPMKKSVTADYLICLEDGKKCKALKRYLRGRYNLTPDQYRAKWGLPRDYPMVAPNYAERRSQIAKQSGLGRKQRARAAKKRTTRR